MYVKEGEGVLVLLRKGRRESLCVREGDVMVIPAGSIVYSANTHRSKWLRVVMLLNYVSFEQHRSQSMEQSESNSTNTRAWDKHISREGPDSYFNAFSDKVLQAAFNSRWDELERVFDRQSKGEIWQASEEQIRELSGSCSRGGGGSGSKEEEIKPTSLPGQKPRYSNNHGRMHTITSDECRHIRDLDMEVGIANITIGSMMAPRYTTHATTIAVVVEGSGYFKMACPHKSDSGQSERREHVREEEQKKKKARGYKQVTAQIKEGSVIVLPAGYRRCSWPGTRGTWPWSASAWAPAATRRCSWRAGTAC
ncbi:hypothetical protein ACQ4PT_001246 [Festuca glaucescens]